MLNRKSDRIKVLRSNSQDKSTETTTPAIIPQDIDFRCINCKERYYFVRLANDDKHLFCTNCGHKTPLRILKHLRGIAGPSIQRQQSSSIIVQPSTNKMKDRKPTSMLNNKIADPAIEMLKGRSGITIIDIQTKTSYL